MTNVNKHLIEESVKTVYDFTNKEICKEYEVKFDLINPQCIPDHGMIDGIRISRSIKQEDLTYKLYTKCDTKPLMTIFGCWPTEFVTDIFISALEHFYNNRI